MQISIKMQILLSNLLPVQLQEERKYLPIVVQKWGDMIHKGKELYNPRYSQDRASFLY